MLSVVVLSIVDAMPLGVVMLCVVAQAADDHWLHS